MHTECSYGLNANCYVKMRIVDQNVGGVFFLRVGGRPSISITMFLKAIFPIVSQKMKYQHLVLNFIEISICCAKRVVIRVCYEYTVLRRHEIRTSFRVTYHISIS